MASKRNIRRTFMTKSCTGKIKHKSFELARIEAIAMNRRRNPEDVLHPYICKFCGSWHLGHIKRNYEKTELKYSYSKKQTKKIINSEIKNTTSNILPLKPTKYRIPFIIHQIHSWENEGGACL